MPLQTSITRDGELVKLSWGQFHVAAMVIAAALDSGKGPFKDNSLTGILREGAEVPDYPTEPITLAPGDCFPLADYYVIALTPLNDGPYTLQHDHHFRDASDGEDFPLKAGDVLHAWRAWR